LDDACAASSCDDIAAAGESFPRAAQNHSSSSSISWNRSAHGSPGRFRACFLPRSLDEFKIRTFEKDDLESAPSAGNKRNARRHDGSIAYLDDAVGRLRAAETAALVRPQSARHRRPREMFGEKLIDHGNSVIMATGIPMIIKFPVKPPRAKCISRQPGGHLLHHRRGGWYSAPCVEAGADLAAGRSGQNRFHRRIASPCL
jgi:hypothetical protein